MTDGGKYPAPQSLSRGAVLRLSLIALISCALVWRVSGESSYPYSPRRITADGHTEELVAPLPRSSVEIFPAAWTHIKDQCPRCRGEG